MVTTEAVLSMDTTVRIEMDTTVRIERQANLSAAHAAAPLLYTNYQIVNAFRLNQPFQYIGPGRYSFVLDAGTRMLDVDSFEHLRAAYPPESTATQPTMNQPNMNSGTEAQAVRARSVKK